MIFYLFLKSPSSYYAYMKPLIIYDLSYNFQTSHLLQKWILTSGDLDDQGMKSTGDPFQIPPLVALVES